MSWEVNRELKSLDYYFSLEGPKTVYVYDLKHCGPRLVKEATARGLNILPPTGNHNKNGKWIRIECFGNVAPTIKWFKLPNGISIVDYSGFDPSDNPTEEEMATVANEISERFGDDVTTASKIVEKELRSNNKTKFLVGNNYGLKEELDEIEFDYYDMLAMSLRGGANAVMKPYVKKLIDVETHIDYHQIYAYVMKNSVFPMGEAQMMDGYYKSPVSIYCISGDAKARVKKDGYPIIPTKDKAAGLNGEWFVIKEVLPYLCDSDFDLLYENYEIKGNLIIDYTLTWSMTFKGKDIFSPMIDKFYEGRKNAEEKGLKNVKNFYKILNEIMAGYFEKTTYIGGFWRGVEPPKDYHKKIINHNPKIGIFITAGARVLLNRLLHMFPHDKVIGYDTDCCFFNGTPEEVPAEAMAMMGPEMGKVHFDGIYRHTVHAASKRYRGFDIEEDDYFTKASGVSKSGYSFRWNKKTLEYEVVKSEESR